ncbi:MAG: CBS domain-containing protein [Anaerolineae bacterium]|nr:CBS domain-containing protein [Anaerolineae bacterium]MDW8174007.1 CBS domain-containing protein [Anaerolineae bacterium]
MFENVTVKEWMTPNPVTIDSSAKISEAHQAMKSKSVRRLPVLHDGKLVGIITIGDVREASPSDATTLSIWELNYLWAQLTVEKVMTKNVISVSPDQSILDAAQIMLEKKISGLPVVQGDQLVGIITESDIFRMLVRSRVPSK